MPSEKNLHSTLADWLARREPTKLVIDGLVLIMVSTVLQELYWYIPTAGESVRDPTAPSIWHLAARLDVLAYLGLYYLAIAAGLVGLVRLIADRFPTRPSSSDGAAA